MSKKTKPAAAVDANNWLDDDGYPTAACLDRLSEWDVRDTDGAIDFMRALWHYSPEWGIQTEFTDAQKDVYHLDPERQYVRLSTGGWSGNEDLVTAFRANPLRRHVMLNIQRGGHIVFEYTPEYTPTTVVPLTKSKTKKARKRKES